MVLSFDLLVLLCSRSLITSIPSQMQRAVGGGEEYSVTLTTVVASSDD